MEIYGTRDSRNDLNVCLLNFNKILLFATIINGDSIGSLVWNRLFNENGVQITNRVIVTHSWMVFEFLLFYKRIYSTIFLSGFQSFLLMILFMHTIISLGHWKMYVGNVRGMWIVLDLIEYSERKYRSFHENLGCINNS